MEKKYPQRTPKQNNAEHRWFREVANALNDAGYEQKITIGTTDTPWTEWAVKAVFKKIAKAMYGIEHTSELTTKETKEAAEVLHRMIGEQGVSVPWPSIEEMIAQQEGWKA